MKKILIYLTLLVFGVGCQPASSPDDLPSPASTLQISMTDQAEVVPSVPAQENVSQPTLENPIAIATSTLWKGAQMPIFLEVTQATTMNKDSAQGPTIGVGPTIYFYHPNSKVLMLHSTITLELTTELLIGVNTVLKTPNQVYEKREIVQFPSMQPALIQISAFDAKTGILNLVYAGEIFNLSPGESRTFKQFGSDASSSTVITKVLNHGPLADIQPASPDGSWR